MAGGVSFSGLSSGIDTGGPASLSQRDRQAFANELDRLLTRFHKPPAR